MIDLRLDFFLIVSHLKGSTGGVYLFWKAIIHQEKQRTVNTWKLNNDVTNKYKHKCTQLGHYPIKKPF